MSNVKNIKDATPLAVRYQTEMTAAADGVAAAQSLISRSGAELVAAYVAVGQRIVNAARIKVEMTDGTAPVAAATDSWSKVRALVWAGVPAHGVTLGAWSESTVNRAVKLSLTYKPTTVADRDAARAALVAASVKKGASKASKDAAAAALKHTAYDDPGFKGIAAFADAVDAGRYNTTTHVITSGSNAGGKSSNVTTIDAAADAATERLATIKAPDATPEDRTDAAAAYVVTGITMGMLTSLSPIEVRVLSKVVTALVKATPLPAAGKKSDAAPVPPVLDSTAPVPTPPAADVVPGISPETLAAALRLVTEGMVTAS